MTLEDSIHSQRLRVLRDAERLGNVSEACRRHGMSRTGARSSDCVGGSVCVVGESFEERRWTLANSERSLSQLERPDISAGGALKPPLRRPGHRDMFCPADSEAPRASLSDGRRSFG